MQLAEPVAATWSASLALGFERRDERSVLSERRAHGPLAIQKALYPEGGAVCHAIVVHPPGGIAGGDELELHVRAKKGSAALLTTPGAGKWYRSSGAWAKQKLAFDVQGSLEWLPRETIVFDGALADLACEVRLADGARYIGWEIVCLGRTGAGERFSRGKLRISARIVRCGQPVFLERGIVDSALMKSPAGLDGKTVFGTFLATCEAAPLKDCRALAATTALPGLVVARYLGDSTEQAFEQFSALWKLLRPAVMDREAVMPRIWST